MAADNINNIGHRRCDHWSYFSRPDQTPHPHQAHCYLYTSHQCSTLRWEVAHMINISKYNMERYRRYLHVYLYRHEGAGSHWTTGRVSTISTCPQQAPVTELETLENFFRASLLRVWFW